jgi:hypothetical protein
VTARARVTAGVRARGVIRVVAMLTLAALAAACSGSKAGTAAHPTGTTLAPTAGPLAGYTPFFLKDGLVSPGHRRPTPPTDALATAVNTLIAGPDAVDTAAGLANAVAKTVGIVSLTQSGDVVTIGFNRKFESANTRPQVGQVVYTLTQFPGVDKVQFLIDGQPNGATGVPPWSRADLEDMTPSILPLSPAPADRLGHTFRCQGLTQLSGEIACAVLDASGRPVASTSVDLPTTTSTTTTMIGVAPGSTPPGSVEFDREVTVSPAIHGPATIVVGPRRAGAGAPLAIVAVVFA